MALTDVAIRTAKPKDKQYKLYDSAGLYLLVKPSGGKYWRLKYRINCKEKALAIGAYPMISLVEAREASTEAKKLLANNVDPSQVKKDQKLQEYINATNSFENVAYEWYNNQRPKWTSRYAGYVLKRIKADIFPALRLKSINKITAPELLTVLRTIETRGAIEIAHRALQTCGQIFRYAIATGRAERDISMDLRGALKTKKVEHHARLEEKDLPEFLQKLEIFDGEYQTKLAMKLLLLTFVRTIELRGAKWKEFDFNKKEWRIPAERMKMKSQHIVPLSTQTIAILNELQKLTSHREFLFPNRNRPRTFISENTILYAIYRMGYHSRATAHGFRATASTILNEYGFIPDVIERQLAHTERNKVRASYNHAQYLLERRKMMQWWADFLDVAKTTKEIPNWLKIPERRLA